jgi:hypothetical protein
MARVFTLSLFLFYSVQIFSQGCSDAGICSIGNLRTDATHINFSKDPQKVPYKHSLIITPSISLGEQRTINFTPSFDATFQLHERFLFNVKTGFNITSGNLGVSYGANDIFASGIFNLMKRDSVNFSLIIGTKISIQKADFSINDKVLPISYQSGVGTNDILFGASFNYKTWYVGAGFQHSLSKSSNSFHFSEYDSVHMARQYFESNRLQRAPDVVLRFEKKFLFRKIRLGLGAGFVFIYHILQDSQLDDAGNRVKIKGSEGTTLNITANVNYKITERWSANLGVGFPVLVRKVRPDGLTRSVVLLPSIQYSF